ncbi:MAG TPA: zf-HC2 domain-containing protein [Bryobacteraceae bacterium]|nr:zf-HC2 domain-containing protein [Bryobacteraceae bacterium]
MNCGEWEERIALHAAGDLPGGEAAEVERHLAECAACRETAEAYTRSLDLMRAAHAGAISPAHYAAVRARVLAKIEAAGRPAWRQAWAWGLAGLASAAFLALMMQQRPTRQITPPARPRVATPEATAVVHVPTPPVVEPAPTRARRHSVTSARRAGPLDRREPRNPADSGPSRTGGPSVIKLLTDDPSVVIYWIADSEGE